MHQELGLDEPVTFCIKNGTGMVRGGSDADDKVVRAAMGRAFEPAQNNANLAAFDDRDIIAIARQTLTRQAGGRKARSNSSTMSSKLWVTNGFNSRTATVP